MTDHPRSAFGAPPRGGQAGRGTVPADCSSPASASGVLAAGAASGPAKPDPRQPLDRADTGPATHTALAPAPPDRAGHATRVFVIRHGQTAWNVQSRIQGHTDIALDAEGLRQAQALGGALADAGIEAIYASDLARALQTAQAVAARTGLAVATEPGLRERGFGVFEGLTHADVSQRWPDAAQRWRRRDPDYGPQGGETLAAFYARSVACAERLAMRHAGQTIAIVTHGGVLDCLYRAATRASLQAPRTWQLGNAVINRLLHSPEGFTVVGWNDAMHLEPDPLAEERSAS